MCKQNLPKALNGMLIHFENIYLILNISWVVLYMRGFEFIVSIKTFTYSGITTIVYKKSSLLLTKCLTERHTLLIMFYVLHSL